MLTPPQAFEDGFRLIHRHAADTQSADLGASPQPLQANRDLPALCLLQNKDVAFSLLISDARAQDMQAHPIAALFGRQKRIRPTTALGLAKTQQIGEEGIRLLAGGQLGRRLPATEKTGTRGGASRSRSGARTRSARGTPYLDEFQGPRFDIPFALGDAADVVVDEEAFGRDAQDQAVRDGADARDELRGGELGEGVVEGVDGFDDDLVGVLGVVWSAVGGRGCRSRGGLGGGVG